MSQPNTKLQDDVIHWLTGLEKMVAEGGWEQEHTLWLCSILPTREGAATRDPLNMVTFAKIPLPGSLDARAGVYLDQFNKFLRSEPEITRGMLRKTVQGQLFAVALASESWTIPSEDIDTWRHRNWSEHPQRDDQRSILAVDRLGNNYAVHRRRSDDTMTLLHAGMGDIRAINGNVPDQLTNILNTFRLTLIAQV